MAGIYGNVLKVSIFGESHQSEMGITLDGLPVGHKINYSFIDKCLAKRRPKLETGTSRIESDDYRIISGVYQDKTTGAPLTIIIKNKDQRSADYQRHQDFYRPSHADYSAENKYLGFNDPRGGGHFSGRLTALIVAAGAIALDILEKEDILIATHVTRSRQYRGEEFSENQTTLKQQVLKIIAGDFPVLTNSKLLEDEIAGTKKLQNSIGGVLETAIIGLKAGYGEPFFNSLESSLSHLIFSVPAVKGIQFGLGFDFVNYYGSEVNDEFAFSNDQVITSTNNNGGINGGISNGQPILFKTIIKPTSSIGLPQKTINKVTEQVEEVIIKGRHDPAIFHRAAIVIDAMSGLALLDLILIRKGQLWR